MLVGLIQACPWCRRVDSGAPWGSSGSFVCALGVVGVIRFISAGPVCRWAHSGSLGSFGRTLVSSGSFGLFRFVRARPGVRRVYSGRWFHFGAPWGSSCSLRFVGLIRACPGGRRAGRSVDSGAP